MKGGVGFEGPDDVPQCNTVGATLVVALVVVAPIQDNDTVNMIRHHDKFINHHPRENNRQLIPGRMNHFARIIQMHFAIKHITKKAKTFLGADSNKIHTRGGVIIALEADTAAADFILVGVH